MNERTTAPAIPAPAAEPDGTDPAGRDDVRASRVSEALNSVMDATDAADADDGLWREAMKDLDAQRPHRPLFRGLY